MCGGQGGAEVIWEEAQSDDEWVRVVGGVWRRAGERVVGGVWRRAGERVVGGVWRRAFSW